MRDATVLKKPAAASQLAAAASAATSSCSATCSAVAARPILVDHALHGEQQIGLALNFVQGHARPAPNQVPRGQSGPLMDLRIVEREVEALGQEGLGPSEGALAGLTRSHQHDDRKGVEGALQQAGRMARQIWSINHDIGDYRLWRGQ